jgi:hypothetical protein
MSYNTGYRESIRGTKYRSFQIGIGNDGPTIFQGPDITDYAVPKEGDLWIQTDTAGFQQYISGSWAAISGGGGGVSPGDLTNAVAQAETYTDSKLAPQADSRLLHVSKVTHSFTPNGSPNAPFNSIQAAHDWAVTNVNENSGAVVILLHPGSYTENVTITRSKTHIRGFFGMQVATAINGNVTVNLTSTGNWTFNRVSLEELQITGAASITNLVRLAGANSVGMYLKRVKLFSAQVGQICLLADNTVAEGARLEIQECDIQASGSGALYDLSNIKAGSYIRNTISESGTGVPMRFRSGTMTVEGVQIGAINNPAIVQMDAGALTVINSILYNTTANSSGFDVASGQLSLGLSFVNVPTGTGKAIKGVSGVVFAHGNNLYQANNQYSTAITSVVLNSTPVAA